MEVQTTIILLLSICPLLSWAYEARTCGSPRCHFDLVAVDSRNGYLLATSQKNLYQYNLDLTLNDAYKEGCTGSKCKIENKILLVDDQHNRVILCQEDKGFECSIHGLKQINKILHKRVYLDQCPAREGVETQAVAFFGGDDASLYLGCNKVGHDCQGKLTSRFAQHPYSKLVLNPDSNHIMQFKPLREFFKAPFGITVNKYMYRQQVIGGYKMGENHLYFIKTYQRSNMSQPQTYVSRFCHSTRHGTKHFEVPISCSPGSKTHLLANATLLTPQGYFPQKKKYIVAAFTSNDRSESSLCAFDVAALERYFFQIIDNCTCKHREDCQKWQPRDVPWAPVSVECGHVTEDSVSDLCSDTLSTNNKQARWPLPGIPLFFNPEDVIASLQVIKVDDYFATFFAGTELGRLIKLRWDLQTLKMDVIENVELEKPTAESTMSDQKGKKVNEAAVKSMASYVDKINPWNSTIFPMTKAHVFSFPIQNCSRYEDCDSCVSSNDQLCGWCILENRCSAKSKCVGSDEMWVKQGSSCPAIISLSNMLSVQLLGQLYSFDSLSIPISAASYLCGFGGFESQANRRGNTFACILPTKQQMDLSSSTKFKDTTLELLYKRSSTWEAVAVASLPITIYQCSAFTSCSTCILSQQNCMWKSDYTCEEGELQIPPESHLKYCPMVTDMESTPFSYDVGGDEKTIYIHEGDESNIEITTNHTRLNTLMYNFHCRLTNTTYHTDRTINARRLDQSSLSCDQVKGVIGGGGNSERSKLSVYLTRIATIPVKVIHIDSRRNFIVESYRCGLSGEMNSCGKCLRTRKEWGCGWCGDTMSCTRQHECPTTSQYLPSNASNICAHPTITQVTPLKVAAEAESHLRIRGNNLDEKLNMRILVAGVLCVPQQNFGCCEVTCKIDKDEMREPRSGIVQLCITDQTDKNKCRAESQYETSFDQEFEFVKPSVTNVIPSMGLVGWGGVVTLVGEHLDAGTSLNITIGDQNCQVDQSTRTNNKVVCLMSCSNNTTKSSQSSSYSRKRVVRRRKRRHGRRSLTSTSHILLEMDGYVMKSEKNFQLVDDVSILRDEYTSPVSIQAGGIPLKVNGTSVWLIEDPVVRLVGDDTLQQQPCTIMEDEIDVLLCTTPAITRNNNLPIDYQYEILSGRGDCKTKVRSEDLITYYPNPTFEAIQQANEDPPYSVGNILYIKGRDICPGGESGCELVNVGVTLRPLISSDEDGDEQQVSTCNVVRVEEDYIQCALDHLYYDASHVVTVKVGWYEMDIGEIRGVSGKKKEDEGISVTVVVIVVVVVIIIFIAVFLLLYKCYTKIKSGNQEVREIQIKMNKLESEVAKACKEAFAELQTDIEENKVQAGRMRSGPPYHDYRIYLIRVLFPDPNDSDRLLDSLLFTDDGQGSLVSNRRKMSLNRFLLLLRNETFIISFIHALESDKSFSMRDRAYVAGFVLIVLQDRLAYATRILEKLLAELINKGVSKESHPKLLFRRTESVAEKMLTHWFSMMLYDFLVNGAGDSLYVLYRGISQQIDKGPVDAITNDARYSLSEDKLLRQSVEAKLVTVKVRNYFEDDKRWHAVKLLSCDSISQAKRKILDYLHGHLAYSQRIHPRSVDLEWRRKRDDTRAEGIILRDQDSSSTQTGGGEWKRINTVEHYQIPDGAWISVVARKVGTLPHNFTSSSMKSFNSSFHSKQDSTTRLLPSGGEGSLPRHKQVMTSSPSSSARCDTPMCAQAENIKYYHLVKSSEQDGRETNSHHNNNNANGKMVAEVYLTRLLTAKGVLQKYVDDLFETIFSVQQRGLSLPIAVKHMFDFLDDQARRHNINDIEIVHTWKTNCLPLRFWVNLIKNPEFVYDIYKSSIVDSCLSVVAQTFMDSCALGRNALTKDSPTNKLLYAKDIPRYKRWVSSYYSDISKQPRLNRHQVEKFFTEQSRKHESSFNMDAALCHLFYQADKHQVSIHRTLNESAEARRLQLSNQLRIIQQEHGSVPPTYEKFTHTASCCDGNGGGTLGNRR